MITWVNCCKRIGHFWNDVTNQFFFLCAVLPLVLEVKCFTSDKHPSFVIQVTTSRLASACLDELRAFCILHNVFALQAEVIIKTLREHIGPTTNIMEEVTGSLDGMYYWAKVPMYVLIRHNPLSDLRARAQRRRLTTYMKVLCLRAVWVHADKHPVGCCHNCHSIYLLKKQVMMDNLKLLGLIHF